MTDREHAAVEAIAQTIRSYDEETIFEAFRIIANRFDWELAKRDPGPDEDVASGNVWPREDPVELAYRAFDVGRAKVIDMTGRLR